MGVGSCWQKEIQSVAYALVGPMRGQGILVRMAPVPDIIPMS